MEINYYRQPNSQGTQEAWESCQFTCDTNLSDFTIKPLVTINGQPILRQHHVTYLTGKETCRAHHFAKHLAIQVLTSDNNKINNDKTSMATRDRVNVCSDSVAAPTARNSDRVSVGSDSLAPSPRRSRCKVLWIDTLHGPHISAAIYRELAAHAIHKQDLHFICLDILGGQRYDFWYINRAIETLIKQKKPDLVVIDDIDHFMPHCGINIATEVIHVVRDVLNHSNTAFLFIGYNHLSKKASTTGNLGKQLFMNANDVFSLSTQREVTTVRHTISYDLSCHPDISEFHFTIDTDNLPHETTPVKKDTTPTATSDKGNEPRVRVSVGSDSVAATSACNSANTATRDRVSVCSDSVAATSACNSASTATRDRVSVCSDSVAASSSKFIPSGRGVDVPLLPKGTTVPSINNSLTLPPLPNGSPCCGIATAPASTKP